MSYLNFPLSSLAFGQSDAERLTTILQWCIIDVGGRVLTNLREAEDDDRAASGRLDSLCFEYETELEQVDEENHDDVFRWGLGVATLGLNRKWQDWRSCKKAHGTLEKFCNEQQQRMRRGVERRCIVPGLKTEWLIEAINSPVAGRSGATFTMSHFMALSAILSKVGREEGKPRAKTVTWPEIQYRSLGYLSEEEMNDDLPHRADGREPLSRRQIDRLTKQLDLLRFLVRYVPKIGKKAQPAWYGVGMEEKAVVTIANSSVRKASGGWQKRHRDQQRAREELGGKVLPFTPQQDRTALRPEVKRHPRRA